MYSSILSICFSGVSVGFTSPFDMWERYTNGSSRNICKFVFISTCILFLLGTSWTDYSTQSQITISKWHAKNTALVSQWLKKRFNKLKIFPTPVLPNQLLKPLCKCNSCSALKPYLHASFLLSFLLPQWKNKNMLLLLLDLNLSRKQKHSKRYMGWTSSNVSRGYWIFKEQEKPGTLPMSHLLIWGVMGETNGAP